MQAIGLCTDQTVSVDSPYFWNDAFTLRRTATGQVACPTFLQPLVQGILSTGKSLLLLRAHQGIHTRYLLLFATLMLPYALVPSSTRNSS